MVSSQEGSELAQAFLARRGKSRVNLGLVRPMLLGSVSRYVPRKCPKTTQIFTFYPYKSGT